MAIFLKKLSNLLSVYNLNKHIANFKEEMNFIAIMCWIIQISIVQLSNIFITSLYAQNNV